MSRDFTPRELYVADKYCAQKGTSLRDATFTLIQPDGKETEMFTAQRTLQKQFPNLGFLCGSLPKLYDSTHFPKSTVDEFFEQVERQLAEYIRFDCEVGGIRPETPETLVEWFHGRLDPSFYYHEENERLFLNWLEKGLALYACGGNERRALAVRLVEFSKNYDYYDYTDALEVGETDDDATEKLYADLLEKDRVLAMMNGLKQIFEEDPDFEDGKADELLKDLEAWYKKGEM